MIEGGLKRKPDAFVILDPADLLFRIDSNSKQHVLWLYSKLKQLLAKYPHAVIILVFNLRKGDRRRKRPDLLINPREWLEEVSGSYDLINHSDVRLGMALRDEEVRVINGIRRGEPMNPVLLKEYALPQGSADEKLRLAGFDEVSADESVFLQSLPEKQIEYFVKLPDTFTFGEVVDKIVPRATLSRLLARGQSLGVIEKADNRYRKTVCLMGPAL